MKKLFLYLLLAIVVIGCSTDNTDNLAANSDSGSGSNGSSNTSSNNTNVDLKWKKIRLNTSEILSNIVFISNKTGFIIGYNGILFKTDDGGKTWNKITTGVTHSLRTFSFYKNQIMINGFKSEDGGKTWAKEPKTIGLGAYYIGKNHLIAQSLNFDGKIYESKDNGASWVEKTIPTKRGGRGHTDGIFENKIGYLGSWYPGELLKTTDNGNTWKRIYHGNDKPNGKQYRYGYTNDVEIEKGYAYISTNRYLLKINTTNDKIEVLQSGVKGGFEATTIDKNYMITISYENHDRFSNVSTNGGKSFKKQKIANTSFNAITHTKENIFVVGSNGALWKAKR